MLCCGAQGSAFYLTGACLVIIGWTIIGLCVEAYGFWLLFCEFIPTVLQFSRRVPFMSKVLDMPFLKVVSNSKVWVVSMPMLLAWCAQLLRVACGQAGGPVQTGIGI